jgi:hypothetical protein
MVPAGEMLQKSLISDSCMVLILGQLVERLDLPFPMQTTARTRLPDAGLHRVIELLPQIAILRIEHDYRIATFDCQDRPSTKWRRNRLF